ncbi:hypothetical protein ACWD5R_36245 [Streptomyces sp. NPDC002514]|uniref:hypothetical protein n=1 Tax=Streptomyces sp. NPDC001270 TaxID=3364554 RepID=UPI0036AC0F19
MAVDPLIELSDVNRYYGEPHVLRDIGLTVGKGEVGVVIGPSGSGTSAPGRRVDRLEDARSGTAGPDGRPRPAAGRTPARPDRERPGRARGHRREEADRRSPAPLHSPEPLARAARAGRPVRAVFRADGRVAEDRAPKERSTSPGSGRAKHSLPKIRTH